MRFWKRPNPEFDVARGAFAAVAPIAGTLQCSEQSCDRHDATACSYTDRRGHSCPTAGCPDHRWVIDGDVFCGLHAATVGAVGAGDGSVSLPEVGNPGPALVSWVARDLHDRVVELLEKNLRADDEERVTIDNVVTPVRGTDGTRRWEQAWKIVNNTGMLLKVVVLVEERSPTVVIVRVGTEQVACGVPPWFDGGGHGQPPMSPSESAGQRRDFYEPIHSAIANAVVESRSAGIRGPY